MRISGRWPPSILSSAQAALAVSLLLFGTEGGRAASRESIPTQVELPFLSGVPFEISWKRDFAIDRADIISCTPLNELGRWHEICGKIFASGEQNLTFLLDDPNADVLGYERPRISFSLETSRGEIRADFVPLGTIRSPLDSEALGAESLRITQRGETLHCETESPKIREATFAVSWTMRNEASGFATVLDTDTLPVAALIGSTTVECSRRLFDGLLFRKIVTQSRVDAFDPGTTSPGNRLQTADQIQEKNDGFVFAVPDFSTSEWGIACKTALASESDLGNANTGRLFVPGEESFEKPIRCPDSKIQTYAKILDGSFLRLSIPGIIAISKTQRTISVPLEILAPKYAKIESIECNTSSKQLVCKIEKGEDHSLSHVVLKTNLVPVPPQQIVLSASVSIAGKRYPISRTALVTPEFDSERRLSNGEITLSVQSPNPDLFQCLPPVGKRLLTETLWFENGTELAQFRGLSQIPFATRKRNGAKLSCLALVGEQAKIWTGVGEIEVKPDPPKFLTPPRALLLEDTRFETKLDFTMPVKENFGVHCEVIDRKGLRLLSAQCTLDNSPTQSVLISIPQSSVVAIRNRMEKTRAANLKTGGEYSLQVQLFKGQESYSVSIPLAEVRPERRPEILASAVYRENDTTYCLFALEDRELDHLTASVQWLDDPDRVELFSTFPRANYSPLRDLTKAGFAETRAEYRLLGRAALKTNARAPSCTVTASDGTLFTRQRALFLAGLEEANRHIKAAIENRDLLKPPLREVSESPNLKGSSNPEMTAGPKLLGDLRTAPFGFNESSASADTLLRLIGSGEKAMIPSSNSCATWFSMLRSGFWPSAFDMTVTTAPREPGEAAQSSSEQNGRPQPWHLSVCGLRSSSRNDN